MCESILAGEGGTTGEGVGEGKRPWPGRETLIRGISRGFYLLREKRGGSNEGSREGTDGKVTSCWEGETVPHRRTEKVLKVNKAHGVEVKTC